jgi:hypothetical protein
MFRTALTFTKETQQYIRQVNSMLAGILCNDKEGRGAQNPNPMPGVTTKESCMVNKS